MNTIEKEILISKLKEIITMVKNDELVQECTLFDPEEVLSFPDDPETKKRTRTSYTDGSMTARSLAKQLTKELGMPVTHDKVVQVGKHCGAVSNYSPTQHAARYTAQSVQMITDIFKSFSA